MDEKFIKIHEEAAEIFTILLYILGVLALIGLWANWKNKSYSQVFSIVTLILAFVVLFYAKQTGTTGGEIRHTEIWGDGLSDGNPINLERDYEKDDD